MDETLIDQIEFRAVAPMVALPGLDNALAKLHALAGALDAINNRLNGLTTHAAFKRTQTGLTETIKHFEEASGKGQSLKQVSEVLGYQAPDVEAHFYKEQERLQGLIQDSNRRRSKLRGAGHAEERKTLLKNEEDLQNRLAELQSTFKGRDLKLTSAEKGGKFFYGYQKAALGENRDAINALQAVMGVGEHQKHPQHEAPPAAAAGVPGLDIPAGAVRAILGPGSISLTVPADRITVSLSSVAPGKGTAGLTPGGGGPAQGIGPQDYRTTGLNPPTTPVTPRPGSPHLPGTPSLQPFGVPESPVLHPPEPPTTPRARTPHLPTTPALEPFGVPKSPELVAPEPPKTPEAKPVAPAKVPTVQPPKPVVLRFAGGVDPSKTKAGWLVQAVMSHGPVQTIDTVQTKKERNRIVEEKNEELRKTGKYVSIEQESAWKLTAPQATKRLREIEGEVFGGKASVQAGNKVVAELALKYHQAKGAKQGKVYEELQEATGQHKAKVPTVEEANKMLLEHKEFQERKVELLRQYDALKPVSEGKEPPEGLKRREELPVQAAPTVAPVAPVAPAVQGGLAAEAKPKNAQQVVDYLKQQGHDVVLHRPSGGRGVGTSYTEIFASGDIQRKFVLPEDYKKQTLDNLARLLPPAKPPEAKPKQLELNPAAKPIPENQALFNEGFEQYTAPIGPTATGEPLPRPTAPILPKGSVPPPPPTKPTTAAAAAGGEEPKGPKSLQGAAELLVPAARIEAKLGPGMIPLTVPTGQIQAVPSTGAPSAPPAPSAAGTGQPPTTPVPPAGTPPATPTPPPRPPGGAPPPGSPSSGGGNLLEEKVTENKAGKKSVQTRELIRAGEMLDTFTKEVDGVMELQKTVVTTSPLKKARARMERQVAEVKAELEVQKALPPAQRNPQAMAGIYRKQASMLRSFVGQEEVNPQTGEVEYKPTRAAKELQGMGQGPVVSRIRAQAAKLEQRAVTVEEQGEVEHQRELAQDMRKTGQMRKALAAAKEKGDREEAQRIEEEIRGTERRSKSVGQFNQARQKSDEKRTAMQKKVQTRDVIKEQERVHKEATETAANARLGDFLASGGRVVSQVKKNTLRPGSPSMVVAERESGGNIERMVVEYGKAEAKVSEFTKAQSQARKEGGYLAGDFVKNTAKVTLWAASVGVLYKSLELVTTSMAKLVEIGPQLGRLEQVFKGVGGNAHQLAMDILEIAAANGADTRQAMEAAIQWSRLGLTRLQVNEAVRVSVMASNVAQMDALEATEALQGVMQAYRLNVGQLRGELSQIVQISNIYNATNADMLTGLSKTAAVAKQAGLSLSELQGLLGATIGGTAQSGANIGNMMKSVILALSNPDLQQKMRVQFRMEPTTGKEEIKPMSDLLADLFVKFQHLNELQRQSMLFSVAGRTQASRLQAMLEGYVKAQVLAVSAQLHLNTAEQENANITAALKTQLHGVANEWERFVFAQGNNGPVQAITQISMAVRNLMKLMNTPVASTAMTGILGLVTAGGIQTVLTGMRMAEGKGFVGRSRAHITSAMGDLNQSMVATMAGAMGGGVATNVGTRQPEIIGGNIKGVTGRMYQWSEALLRVGRSSSISNAGLRAMATAMGAVTRALGVGMIALRQWILPMVAIGVAIYGFNRAMEAMGLSSDAAERKLAGFNDEAMRAAAAADAYGEAAKALSTIQRAIQPEKGFQPIKPDAQKRFVEQATDLAGLYEPDMTKQEALQRTFKAQAAALMEQGDAAGLLKLLSTEQLKLEAERRVELQKQFVAMKTQQRTLTDEKQRLTARQTNPVLQYIGGGTRQNRIKEIDRQMADLGSNKTKNLIDQADAYEQQVKYDTRYQSELRGQKLLWESIAEIYQQVNTNNPMERAHIMVSGLEAQNKAIQAHITLLEQEDQVDVAGKTAQQKRIKDLGEEEAAVREKLMGAQTEIQVMRHAGKASRHPTRQQESEVQEMQDRLQVIEREKGETESGVVPGEEGLGFARRQSLRSADVEAQKEKTAEAEAYHHNYEIFETQTQMQFGREEARRETTPFAYGRDETQKLLNQRQGIQQRIGEVHEMPQTTERMSRELELQNELYETQIALRRRSFDVERDIRQLIVDQRKEMEHSILGAGPGELLRKMAAIRMGSSGSMGIGQFMSLSPEMRRDVAMVDTRFDPHMIDLQRERQRTKREPTEDFNQKQLDISSQIAELSKSVQESLPKPAAYEAAKASIDSLGNAAQAAAAKVNLFGEQLGQIYTGLIRMVEQKLGATSLGTAPRNPQSGGVGAGAGFSNGK